MKAEKIRGALNALQGIVTFPIDCYEELDRLEADANELVVREKGVKVVIRKGILVCGRCYSCAEGNMRYCDSCGIKLTWKDR